MDFSDLAPVRDELDTDLFGRYLLPGHFPVGLSRMVVFDPQDKGHKVSILFLSFIIVLSLGLLPSRKLYLTVKIVLP